MEQAKILFAEAEENNLDSKAIDARWNRWYKCSLCEQYYHGVVRCALGWACWKTYVGRAEADQIRTMAMNMLGNGLCSANYDEDALSVKEAELATMRRIGAPEEHLLAMRGNLALTYKRFGRRNEALRLRRDVYSGTLKLHGEDETTLAASYNYADSLSDMERFEEANVLMRKTMPVARRVLGQSHELTLRIRLLYAGTLYMDTGASLNDLREAVTTLEDTVRVARRVLGSAHPSTEWTEDELRNARATLRAREGA